MIAINQQYSYRKVLNPDNLYNDIYKNDFVDALLLKFKYFTQKTELLDQLINSSDSNSTVTPSFSYYNTTGDSYFATQDYLSAIKSYQKSLELEPNQAYVYYRIGIIFEMQGLELVDITKYYMMAIMLNPDFTVVDDNLYSMLLQSKGFYGAIQWYITQAETNLDKINNHDLYFNLGRFCYATENVENAIKCFLIAIRLNPDHAKAHYNLGLLYDRKGLLDESINSLLKTVELEPESAEAYFVLGHKYFKKADFYRSALSYTFARDIDPAYNLPNQSLGNIYQNFQIG